MNNLEKMLQDYEATENPVTLIRFFMFSGFPACDNCYVSDFCDMDKESSCSATRARWLLEEYAEPDSWERIEADAKKSMSQYWGCVGENCYDCPAVIDGLKPHDRYNTGSSCSIAKACDLVVRCKKLAGVE